MSAAAQVQAWKRALAQARSTTIAEVPGGVVLHNADLPLAHDHNVVLLWQPTNADAAAHAAESILGGVGIAHLAIEVHGDALAGALEPGLAARGYERSNNALMRLVGPPPPVEPPKAVPVVETIGIDERVAIGAASWLDENPAMPAEERRQVSERIRGITPHVEATFMAIRGADGVPIAYVDCYVREGIAQLEELYTLSDFRNAGVAKALIRAGIRRATAATPSVVFLVVDEDGGPGRLYERFGFEAFGRTTTFAKDVPAPRSEA